MSIERSSALFIEAKNHIPGGVNSPVRAFKSVGGTPIFMHSAKGAYMIDADGNSYIDYINSWGPMILGHSHPEVIDAVQKQIFKGFSFGTPTELEVEIAKLITPSIDGIDQIRMVSSGTEACMSAIRLARGFTGKNKIIKFAGCYHGHADAFLIQAGSGAATFGNPSSLGVTQAVAQDTLVCTFNDLRSVEACFGSYSDDIAAVILEPVAGNMGCIPPDEGFLEGLRTLCYKYKTLLIFDEVMTGFRFSFGGVMQLSGVVADIVCYGKVIGGGLPVGAFAARKEIMDYLAPNGPVYQAGTLSGNPVAMAAGFATLSHLKNHPDIYSQIESTTSLLAQEFRAIFHRKGIPALIQHSQSMISVFFTDKNKISNFADVAECNHTRFNEFFHHMLKSGVYLPPSGYETWFVSAAIADEEINKTLEAVEKFSPSTP